MEFGKFSRLVFFMEGCANKIKCIVSGEYENHTSWLCRYGLSPSKKSSALILRRFRYVVISIKNRNFWCKLKKTKIKELDTYGCRIYPVQ